MDSKDKSDTVKRLALDGQFPEVEEKYGAKARAKAIIYAEGKLNYLKEQIAEGASIESDKSATAFMQYAIKSGESAEKASPGFLCAELQGKEHEPLQEEIEPLETARHEPADLEESREAIESSKVNDGDSPDHEAAKSAPNSDQENKKVASKFTTPLGNTTAKSFTSPRAVSDLSSSSKPAPTSKGPVKAANHKPAISKIKPAPKDASPRGKSAKTLKADMFPNAPKKPTNAFMLYTAFIRGEIVKESPGISVGAVAKEAGSRWKDMEETEKGMFESQAKSDKLRYTKELLEYKDLHPKEAAAFEAAPKRCANKKAANSESSPQVTPTGGGKSKAPAGKKKHAHSDDAFGVNGGDQKKRKRLKKNKAAAHKSRSSSEQSEDLADSSHPSSSASDNDDSSSEERDSDHAALTKKRQRKDGASTGRHSVSRGSAVRATAATSDTSASAQHTLKDKPVLLTPNTEKILAASAVTVSSLKGIKEDNLPRSEDIRQTITVPRATGAFPPDFIPKAGQEVVLVLQPYKDFVAQLSPDTLSAEQSEMVKEVCALTGISVVTAHVLELEQVFLKAPPPPLPPRGEQEELQEGEQGDDGDNHQQDHPRGRSGSNEQGMSGLSDDEEEIEIRRPSDNKSYNKNGDTAHKRAIDAAKEPLHLVTLQVGDSASYRILYAPFSSPYLQTDTYLLDRKEFAKSLKAPWLKLNAQVRRAFANSDGSTIEWVEGNIYHIREDVNTNPCKAVSVVWLQLEDKPRQWFYDYSQESNECSPWDLQLSSFIASVDQIQEAALPRELMLGPITPNAILNYIKNMDFASVFLYKLSFNSEYCAMFPNKDDRLDLHIITQRSAQGRYGNPKGDNLKGDKAARASRSLSAGIMLLFQDLLRMTANGKKFNNCNRDFQPWRLCDMVEKTVQDLQRSLITLHGVTTAAAASSIADSSSLRGRPTAAAVPAPPSSQFSQSSSFIDPGDLCSQIEGDLDEL